MENDNQNKILITNPMTDTAQDIFTKILNERLAAGALEQSISKRVDQLIESTTEDLFRSYGDVSKALKEKLTEAIMPTIEGLDDLPVYHDFVMNRLKVAAQGFYDNRLGEAVDAELKEIMSEIPEQITLSWLVDKILEESKNEDEGEGEITLIIEDTFDFYNTSKSVYIDKEPDTSKRGCAFNLHLSLNENTGKYNLLSVCVDGKQSGNCLSIGRLYNFEKVLFNIYAMKGEIELDQGFDAEDYETTWSNWD